MPHDPDESSDAVHTQLTKQVKALAEEVRSHGGTVPPESLANIQRLAELAKLQRDLAPVRHGNRWVGAALFAATVALVSVLLLAHVRESEVELDLVVSELRFQVDSRQQLTDTLQLATLGASGLSQVALPGLDESGKVPALSVRLSADNGSAAAGTISLEPVVAPAHAEMTLRLGDVPGELRLSMSHLDEVLRADVSGTIRAAAPRFAQKVLTAVTPQPIALTPGSAQVNLELAPRTAGAGLFAPGLTITELGLMRIDEVSEGDRTAVRAVSTVQSGSVHLEELGGRELRLRAHEGLRFALARGEVRSIGVKDGALTLNFHGRVRGMASGPLDHPRNLMPRWLDWLRENQPLSLLWGSAVYLFGLSTAVRQWWKKSD
ncbi:MAG TPA: hypothetical protein VKP66_10425 [Steroidobacteraceae bacterium]|nr:hypothetical protein [Steroidobacteraceae bacterium]